MKLNDGAFLIILGCLLIVGAVMSMGDVRRELHGYKKLPEYKLYDYRVVRVIDGDTVEVEAPWLPTELRDGGIKLRIYGIDTPEKGHLAKCELENTKSLNAKAFVETQIAKAKEVRVWFKEWDKYGGRVVGDVLLDNQWLSLKMIANGYAVDYYGAKKNKDWCK